MAEEQAVDYFQAMRDYDRSQRKQADDFDIPLQSSEAELILNMIRRLILLFAQNGER